MIIFGFFEQSDLFLGCKKELCRFELQSLGSGVCKPQILFEFKFESDFIFKSNSSFIKSIEFFEFKLQSSSSFNRLALFRSKNFNKASPKFQTSMLPPNFQKFILFQWRCYNGICRLCSPLSKNLRNEQVFLVVLLMSWPAEKNKKIHKGALMIFDGSQKFLPILKQLFNYFI